MNMQERICENMQDAPIFSLQSPYHARHIWHNVYFFQSGLILPFHRGMFSFSVQHEGPKCNEIVLGNFKTQQLKFLILQLAALLRWSVWGDI